jgi:hypothetical protein
MTRPPASPVILFGAFDRHNLGDLLFPHVAAALLPGRELLFAGLADRDLRPFGGHLVRPLARVVAELGDRRAMLLHVGGEVLTCDAWQAAVMLLSPDEAQPTIARLDTRPLQRRAWARAMLNLPASAPNSPYAASREQFPELARVVYAGVGGVALDECDPALRAEVLTKLAAADTVTVRDRRTLAHLDAAGVAARLLPDPVVMVAELFGPLIRARAGDGEPARILAALPKGYLAVQFSADFGDDDTLARIAAQLDRAIESSGCGVALFRAGAAPWHDDLDVLRRTAARMRSPLVQVFESLDIWDICALIASSRGYCGSSLHGRIVAMAFALPRVNLHHPSSTSRSGKQAAFAATWDTTDMPASVGVDESAEAIDVALSADRALLDRTARQLASRYRQGFDAIHDGPR